jgi:hypothetical protein
MLTGVGSRDGGPRQIRDFATPWLTVGRRRICTFIAIMREVSKARLASWGCVMAFALFPLGGAACGGPPPDSGAVVDDETDGESDSGWSSPVPWRW